MTATERLRELLDERGVEWEDMSALGFLATLWHSDDAACTALEGADDIPHGKVSVQACLTPEQAVDATLGSCNCTNGERTNGTCHEVMIDRFFRGCSECGYMWEFMYGIGRCQRPNFCPNCGRKVVTNG